MAFPTNTTLLDDYTRADSTVAAGPNWSTPVFPGDTNLGVIGNQGYRPAAGWGSSYLNSITPGPDTEVFLPWSTKSDAIELLARIINPNSGTVGGYLLDVTGNSWSIWKIVSNIQTQIGSSVTQAIASGDLIGFELIGTAIKGYIKVGAGAWTQVISVTDATHAGAGRIGIAALNTTQRWDDFSGGTVVTGGTPKSAADTGVGTDTTSLTAAIPSTETGAGVDTPTLAAVVPSAETGVGTETGSLAAALPAPDTSVGIDAAALAAALSAADAALGNDSFSVLAPGAPTFSDLGSGTDAFSVSVQISLAEAGTATETTTLQFATTLANTGVGADAVSAIAALLVPDSGVGSDTVLAPVAFITVGESPLSTDTGNVVVSYVLGETAVGVDAFSRSSGLFLGTAIGQGRIDPLSPRGRIESSLAGRIERPSGGSIERRTL